MGNMIQEAIDSFKKGKIKEGGGEKEKEKELERKKEQVTGETLYNQQRIPYRSLGVVDVFVGAIIILLRDGTYFWFGIGILLMYILGQGQKQEGMAITPLNPRQGLRSKIADRAYILFDYLIMGSIVWEVVIIFLR